MKMIQEEMNMAKQKEAAVVPTVVDSVETLEAICKDKRKFASNESKNESNARGAESFCYIYTGTGR